MRIDSPVVSTGIRIADLLILNLWWLIGCLPVVTIGTSAIAAYTVTLKMTEDREGAGMTAQFWKAYIRNLKHGIPLTLILLAGCGSIWLDVQMIENHTGDAMGLLTAGILLAEFLLVTQLNTPLRLFSAFFLPMLMIYTVSKAVMPVFRKMENSSGTDAEEA